MRAKSCKLIEQLTEHRKETNIKKNKKKIILLSKNYDFGGDGPQTQCSPVQCFNLSRDEAFYSDGPQPPVNKVNTHLMLGLNRI